MLNTKIKEGVDELLPDSPVLKMAERAIKKKYIELTIRDWIRRIIRETVEEYIKNGSSEEYAFDCATKILNNISKQFKNIKLWQLDEE